MSGALSCMRRLRRLLRLMTRRYRSLRSEVAKRPPSSWTMGRISGGMTGSTSMIIHSGRLPLLAECLDDLQALDDLRASSGRWPPPARRAAARRACRRSICCRSFLMASAPMPASKSSSYFSRMSRYSFSDRIWQLLPAASSPGSVTIYAREIQHLFQHARGQMSSIRPMRDGMPLKYQMWLHGRGQLDMAHALAANLGARDLDAAAVADLALVADLLILAAVALPVLRRARKCARRTGRHARA